MVKGARKLVNAALLPMLIASVLPVFGQQAQSGTKEPAMKDLRIAPSKLLAAGSNELPSGPHKLLTYKLEEVELPVPIELEIRGKKERFATALRLTITSESIQGAHAVWLGDASLPNVFGLGPTAIGTFIYDRAILRDGALISVQDEKGLSSLPEPLKLPQSFRASTKTVLEEGNAITSIHSALRIAGTLREPLVVIEFRTSRSLPQGLNDGYYVQIGKALFMGLSCADSKCQAMALQLTAREFAELKDGDLVAISYGSRLPDHSGSFGSRLWAFGPLNKSMLDR